MKTCRVIEKSKLQELMKEYELIYDVVRIVDPKNNQIISWDEHQIKIADMEPCFSVWEKDEPCDNCISLGACVERRRMTKFEFHQNDIYSVVAMPFLVKDSGQEYLVSLELVNKITNDMVLHGKGNSQVVEDITNLNQKLYQDSLTGVYNRRYYDEKKYLYEMSYMMPKKLAFLVADVDRFKLINDRFGHMAGDEVLSQVATVFQQNLRDTDKVIRVGGDEFLVILKDCSRAMADRKMVQLKKAVEKIHLDTLGETRLSISMGLSYTEN